SLTDLARHYGEAGPPKGEIVVLVGPPEPQTATPEAIDDALRRALADHGVKQAASLVAKAYDLPKRDLYQRALGLKGG
ncbi:MAG: 16S rRNA (cytidine(1402)-2'-O)-methyltransferase, partial [Pseudomonadota bacterium]